MIKDKADMERDISTVMDRNETVVLMEPPPIAEGSRHRSELTHLAVESGRPLHRIPLASRWMPGLFSEKTE
jgi:hypothetical protein